MNTKVYFLFIVIFLSSCVDVKVTMNNTSGQLGQQSSSNPVISQNFISTWKTTFDGQTTTLPLRSGFNYNFTVNWGDGSPVDTITSDSDPLKTHTYATSGDHIITISGTLEAWYFNNTGDKDQIISVTNFGDMGWINLKNAFRGCSNMTSFSGGKTDLVTDMFGMFQGATNLTNLDISQFKTHNVTDMSHMFRDLQSLTSLNLTTFNTNSVTKMISMFSGSNQLTSLIIDNFNTSLVTNMAGMFYDLHQLNTLDLSSFITSSVTNMNLMFGTMNLLSLDIDHFDTSSVTNMGSMFSRFRTTTTLDLSNFDTSNVTNMSFMFHRAGSLTSLDLKNFDISAVTTMESMFEKTSSLTSIDMTGWPDVSGINGSNSFLTKNISLIVTCDQPGNQFFTETCGLSNSFVSTWKTTTDNETITLPLRSGFNYSFAVDWGDGSPSDIITSESDSDKTHNYLTAGDYTVTIWGTLEAWHFNNTGDKNKILTVTNFGDMGWLDLSNAFYGCLNLTSFVGGNTSTVSNMTSMFQGATALTNLNLSSFDTSNVIAMTSMFENVSSLSSLFLSKFKTASVINMDKMFKNANGLTQLDLSNFNTSSVNNMDEMFLNTSSLTSLNALNWANAGGLAGNDTFTGKNGTLTVVCDQGGSFGTGSLFSESCQVGESFISSWRVLANGESITLPLRAGYNYDFTVNWGDGSPIDTILSDSDVKKTHTYTNSGDYTITLTGLAEAWYFNGNTQKDKILSVTNLGNMGWKNLANAFYGCTNLSTLAGGVTSNVTNMSQMFRGASGLSNLDFSTFDTSNVTSMASMFAHAGGFTTLDLSYFNTSSVTNMYQMFRSTDDVATLDLSGFDTSSVTDMSGMFFNYMDLINLDISNFDTTNVTTMSIMFRSTWSLTAVNLLSFNTANVSSMSGMFWGANKLTDLNLSSFNTKKVTNLSNFFKDATQLQTVNLSSFDTSNVTSMGNTFYNASKLTSLNLAHFDTRKVTTMKTMFYNTASLTSLNTNGHDLSLVGDSTDIFTNSGLLAVTCDQGNNLYFTLPCL